MNTSKTKLPTLVPSLTIGACALMVATTVQAQGLVDGDTGDFGVFIENLTILVNSYLIPFLIALAVLGFIYGVFQYFILGSDDEEKRGQGRSLMLYAIIGFVAIVALWGIVNFVVDAFGFTDETFTAPGGPSVGG